MIFVVKEFAGVSNLILVDSEERVAFVVFFVKIFSTFRVIKVVVFVSDLIFSRPTVNIREG